LELTFIFGPPLAPGLAAVSSTRAALACAGLVLMEAMASFAPWGLGSLAGGLVAARRGGGAHRAAGLARILAALALGHAALAVTTTSLMAIGAVLLVAGVAIAPAYATINAMADQAAPEGTVTEAFAWLSTAVVTGTSAGTAAGGALAQSAGAGAAFALAGLAGALAVAITMRRSRTVNRQVVPPLGTAIA